ncbi:MAG: AAA family ATPase [Flavobacteriales bacterium]|nr:AAA family ATPase [Flavobacteriales bacterium]
MAISPQIIAIVGPESTGKTTLAHQLADHFDAALVNEFSRSYLHALGTAYQQHDLVEIANGQFQLEREALATGRTTIVCDTDLIVIKVWSEVKYGHLDDRIPLLLKQQPARIHLLARPDIAWEADPLRENPYDRDMLFEKYERVLQEMGASYGVVSGLGEARFRNALTALHHLLEVPKDRPAAIIP